MLEQESENVVTSRVESGEPYKKITRHDLERKWEEVVSELEEHGITIKNPDKALNGAILLR